MDAAKAGWDVLDGDSGLLFREYEFAKNAVATTLVFRGAGDKLVVMSPHNRPSAAQLDALSDHGVLSAIIAPNGYHHLGIAAWRERFPDATVFAGQAALARIAKKCPAAGDVRPIEEASALVGDKVRAAVPDGDRGGNVMLTIETPRGSAFYTSDYMANLPQLPPALPLRMLFKLTDSGPGFKLFRLAVMLFGKDKAKLRSWMEAEIERAPLLCVVPAHGRPVLGSDVLARTREQLARL